MSLDNGSELEPPRPGLNSSFCSMKKLGVFLFSRRWDPGPSQGYLGRWGNVNRKVAGEQIIMTGLQSPISARARSTQRPAR